MRLEEIAREKGLSMYKIAQMTGLSNSSLSEWKRGKGKPTIENIITLANCLNCSIDYLVGRTDVDYWPQIAKNNE